MCRTGKIISTLTYTIVLAYVTTSVLTPPMHSPSTWLLYVAFHFQSLDVTTQTPPAGTLLWTYHGFSKSMVGQKHPAPTGSQPTELQNRTWIEKAAHSDYQTLYPQCFKCRCIWKWSGKGEYIIHCCWSTQTNILVCATGQPFYILV